MNEKRFRGKVDQELRFTQEDRNKVFGEINKQEKNIERKSISLSRKLAPIAALFMAIGLGIFLFVPSILSGNFNNNGSNASGVVSKEGDFITTLITVKDEENRIPLNLLFTYSKKEKRMNVASIPRDAYVPIMDKEEGAVSYDKLAFAYRDGSAGAESVKATVSELFDLSIDYYAVMDLDIFSSMIQSVGGIEYELEEDMRIRAITESVFDFEKGRQSFNGEEIVAFLMDVAYGRTMDEEDQEKLIYAVMDQASAVLPQLSSEIEGNVPFDQLIENKVEIPKVHSLSLIDGMIDTMIDENYYLKFEKDHLNSVVKELTTFN